MLRRVGRGPAKRLPHRHISPRLTADRESEKEFWGEPSWRGRRPKSNISDVGGLLVAPDLSPTDQSAVCHFVTGQALCCRILNLQSAISLEPATIRSARCTGKWRKLMHCTEHQAARTRLLRSFVAAAL